MTIHELRLRSNKFVSELDKKIESVVSGNPYLVDLNKKQLNQSKLSTGAAIKPLYSKMYAQYKGFKTPDLKDTGDFYREMFIKYASKSYTISSDDWKTEKLMGKYKPEIFGISKENQPKAQEITTKLLAVIYKQDVLN